MGDLGRRARNSFDARHKRARRVTASDSPSLPPSQVIHFYIQLFKWCILKVSHAEIYDTTKISYKMYQINYVLNLALRVRSPELPSLRYPVLKVIMTQPKHAYSLI